MHQGLGAARIPVAGPSITEKEVTYVVDAVANAWYGNAATYHERFASAFAAYLGVRFAVPLPSCTSAIHLALVALGVGYGHEVIVPDVTWIASAAPVTYVGATPVFADIDRKTWCLDARAFESLITSRTKAVIPVDLYGQMPDMDPIVMVARRHGIAVIEDAAEAIGSTYKGRKAGSLGDVGVFSFHGSKTLTTGEGGMLVSDREDIYRRVLVLADHGREPDDKSFWNIEVAYKYKMSNLQAALGLAQLERIEELISRKRQIFAWYERELRGVKGVALNQGGPGTDNTYWMVTAVIDQRLGIRKERLVQLMGESNIDCRPFFYPLSSLPAYEDSEQARLARESNKTSYEVSPYGINLPSALNLTEEHVAYVSQVLRRILHP